MWLCELQEMKSELPHCWEVWAESLYIVAQASRGGGRKKTSHAQQQQHKKKREKGEGLEKSKK